MALMMWLQIGIRTNANLKKKMLKRVLMLTALLLIGLVVVVQFQSLSDAASQKEFGGGNFSGRDQIWAQAIKEWTENPLFGYGPTIWSEEYREQVDMNYAFHAHSQLFQTLGESGIVGLCSLLFFLQVVIGCYRQRLTREKILTFTVLTFLLIRSITEPSFRTLVAFGGDTMLVAIIYISTLICLTQGWSRSPQKVLPVSLPINIHRI